MHKAAFFSLGNADSCRIDSEAGKKILFDYAATRCANDEYDVRIDLATELRADLKQAKRNDYDVVAFTHFDKDHICGSSGFFYLEHATKYQTSERIKIRELWVPLPPLSRKVAKMKTRSSVRKLDITLRRERGSRILSSRQAERVVREGRSDA